MSHLCLRFRPLPFFRALQRHGIRYIQTQALESSGNLSPIFSQSPAFSIDKNPNIPITTGLNIKIEDKPGSLKKILEFFAEDNINLTDLQIKNVPLEASSSIFHIFFNDDDMLSKSSKIKNLLEKNLSAQVTSINSKKIKWFPQCEDDLKLLNAKTISRDDMLGTDHPGVHDVEYRKRRDEIAMIANSYVSGPLPYIEYTSEENKLWSIIFNKLYKLYQERACNEFLVALDIFIKDGIYSFDKIPQMRDVSNALQKMTGFKLRPVTGLLDSRDFLNALAFKVFFATQYLRHPSRPFYTPEPDLIHELLGHCSLLSNKDFAEFTQMIGLASLGASDDQIELLTHLYWYTNEFGLLFQNGKLKAYGAGVLSSLQELDLATRPSNKAVKIYEFTPDAASKKEFDFTDLQNTYFAAKSLAEIREKCQEFTQEFLKPFSLKYNPETNSVKLSNSITPVPVALQF